MSNNRIVIKGGAELKKFLSELPIKVETNIMRGALRAGGKVLLDQVKQNVPVEYGELRKSVRVSTASKKGIVTATVKAGNEKAFYWRFVEFGTAAHIIKAKNKGSLAFGNFFPKHIFHPGATAKPFMRPALDAKAAAAIQAAGDMIIKRLTKEGINTADEEFSVEEN